jgi:sulfur carrier protein
VPLEPRRTKMPLQASAATQIRLNGAPTATPARTLADLVAVEGHSQAAVATAVNGDFVPRQERAATLLADGDRVEIVAPRQGG